MLPGPLRSDKRHIAKTGPRRSRIPREQDRVGWSQRNERVSVMNHAYGWMGGGMWIWTVIGVLIVVLLVVAINRVSTK
jgi:hypothetical protein